MLTYTVPPLVFAFFFFPPSFSRKVGILEELLFVSGSIPSPCLSKVLPSRGVLT